MHDRREFLIRTGGGAAAAWLALALEGCADEAAVRDGPDGPPPPLTDAEVRTLEAAADMIIPPDGDAPGAAAMGAVSFMEGWFAQAPPLRQGAGGIVAALDGAAAGRGADSFADLGDEDREAVMADFESDGLFGLLQLLVVAGVLSDPVHGGNREGAGWAMIGFEPRGAWQPPFGAYDAGRQGTSAG